eukprot:m51a1_g13828 hypothetical protein (222) ;mRNA; r:483671-484531
MATTPLRRSRIVSAIEGVYTRVDSAAEDVSIAVAERKYSTALGSWVAVAALNALLVWVATWRRNRTEISVGLVLVSVTSALFWATRKKRYQLYNYAPEGTRLRPNLPVEIVSFGDGRPDATWHVLTLWEPGVFSSMLFRFFNPVSVLCCLMGNPRQAWSVASHVALGAVVSALAAVVVSKYEANNRCRDILQRATYDDLMRFMNSKLSVVTKSVQTQTQTR